MKGGFIMEFIEVLNYVLYTVLTTIIPVIATYIVKLIKLKITESKIIAKVTKNEAIAKQVENAISDVMDAVLYVNQTYTDSIKASGEFNEIAQKKAFDKAYIKAVELISQGTQDIIQKLYGSFDKWLELKIESAVNIAKKQ